MAVRATGLKNFKGDNYVTEPMLTSAIAEATGGESGLIDKKTGNLRHDLNPIHITSIDNPTPSNATQEGADTKDQDFSNIQFIGDCKVFYREGGKIVIRIGENLNSSNFGTEDGQTNANGSCSSPAATNAKLPNDTSVNWVTGGNYTVGTQSNGLVHFPDNTGTKFEVVVNDGGTLKTYYFGPVTGNGTYVAKDAAEDGSNVTGVTLSITNWGDETRVADGATGYCAKVSFTIPASAIAGGDAGNVSISKVTCRNSEGNFDYVPTGTERYFGTDTAKKPTASTVTATFSKTGTKQESGVTYITGGKVKVSATGTDFKTPAYIDDNCGTISANTGFSNKTIAGSNLTSNTAMTYDGIALNSGIYTVSSITVTPKNINGAGTAASTNPNAKILQYTATGLINEANRLQSDLKTAWNSATYLADIDNGDGLQVYNGCIRYPQTDFTDYNSITGLDISKQPNYSKTSGDKTYYQKLTLGGTLKGGTITLTSVASTNGVCGNTTNGFDVLVWNGTSGNGWLNISKVGDGYIATAVSYGTTTTLKFEISQAIDYGPSYLYVKIVYKKGCVAQIKNITLA